MRFTILHVLSNLIPSLRRVDAACVRSCEHEHIVNLSENFNLNAAAGRIHVSCQDEGLIARLNYFCSGGHCEVYQAF